MIRKKNDKNTLTTEEKQVSAQSLKEDIKNFIINLVTTVLVIGVIFTFVFGLAINSGESMYPRIRDGDVVLFYRIAKEWHTEDVITFKEDGTCHMARIVASAGDEVDMTEEGELLVNGYIQQEDIFYPTYKEEATIEFPYQVPDDSVFVLNDFRTHGVDSRTFGAIALDDVDGKVIGILRRRGI